MSARQVGSLPANAEPVTEAVLTRGSRVRQGWRSGGRYLETYHYPGALNWESVVEHDAKPDWAPAPPGQGAGYCGA